jgi:hypothetical protein
MISVDRIPYLSPTDKEGERWRKENAKFLCRHIDGAMGNGMSFGLAG